MCVVQGVIKLAQLPPRGGALTAQSTRGHGAMRTAPSQLNFDNLEEEEEEEEEVPPPIPNPAPPTQILRPQTNVAP